MESFQSGTESLSAEDRKKSDGLKNLIGPEIDARPDQNLREGLQKYLMGASGQTRRAILYDAFADRGKPDAIFRQLDDAGPEKVEEVLKVLEQFAKIDIADKRGLSEAATALLDAIEATERDLSFT